MYMCINPSAETWTHLLNPAIHIQVDSFGGIGGGAGAHVDLPLLSYTAGRF